MHNHSYKNEFNLHANEISFSNEKMGTKIRLEEEAKGNSEMAYRVFSRHQILKSKTKEPPIFLSSLGIRGTNFIYVYNFPAQ